MADHFEATRWFQLTPLYTPAGDIRGIDVNAMTKRPPRNAPGVIIKLKFQVPKTTFKPVDVTVQLSEENMAGTPRIVIAELEDLKKDLA